MNAPQRLSVALVAAFGLLGVAPGQVAPRGLQATYPPISPPEPRAAAVLVEPAPVSAAVYTTPRAAAPAPPIDDEVLELRRDIERLIGSSNADRGILVVSLDRGDTLFSHNPDLPLAPASNMKLFTTAAALYYLGPNFRYSTYALADGAVHDGVLFGDLILYGTGDPAISSRMLSGSLDPLRALADSLVAQGIRDIRGDIVGDGSYFDDQWIGDGWRDGYRLASYSAPIGALSLGENVVSVRVMPGSGADRLAAIRTTPDTDGLLILNQVTTVASGRSRVRFSYTPEGLLLEGQIARGHPGVARTVTVVDPANFAASAFREVLDDAGITVHGIVRTISDPLQSPIGRNSAGDGEGPSAPPRVLGTHLSPTLAEVVSVTNHVSQNLFAEAMFKTVGRIALGEGSFDAGARAVRYFLECEKPIDLSALRFVDGSGLSPLNRITPRAMIHLLDLMTRMDVWEQFYNSLPEAASREGGDHSLRNRMGSTAAALNLRAKTGTISEVSSLSGYVRAANDEMIAFSILSNDARSTWQAKRMEDAIGARLARFTRPEPVEPTRPLGTPVATDASTGEALEQLEVAAPSTPVANEPAPAAATSVHSVARGETLDEIARRYGTSVAELERLNPEIQPRRLQIGQSITVPARP